MAATEAQVYSSHLLSRNGTIKSKVPNHLLDTKIFARVGTSSTFHIKPESVHFPGYVAGYKQSDVLHIINVSPECQRMHIIPPNSSNFSIKYKKKDALVPGFHLEVAVEFLAHDYGHYSDYIRIHSKDEENLVVPIHAYPICDISFPKILEFKSLPIGQSKTKKIPLKSNVPVDFEFQIDLPKKNPAFVVSPLQGIIPGNGQIDIRVTYSPTEYCTSMLQMELKTSQFNSNVYSCTCSGYSEPGLAKKLNDVSVGESVKETGNNVLDPRVLSPLGRLRSKRKETKKATIDKREDEENFIILDGIRFPKNLNNVSSVCTVLTQKVGKLNTKELRAVVKARKDQQLTAKQMKLAVYEHLVQQTVKEEERNQMRWCVRLGENPLLPAARRKILEDRKKAIQLFKIATGEKETGKEFDRSSTFSDQARIQRQADFIPEQRPTFDLFLNDTWEKRQLVLGKFIQAVWKVIIRRRATLCLQTISRMMNQWRSGDFADTHVNLNELNEEEKIVYNFSLKITPEQIKPRRFLKPDDIDNRKDMALDSIKAVPFPTTSLDLKDDVSCFNLVVPLEFKVLGYQRFPVDCSTRSYTKPGLCRALRSEDNYLELRSSNVAEDFDPVSGRAAQEVEDAGLASLDRRTPLLPGAEENMKYESPSTVKFEIPQALLDPPKYHPMHIFNPLPGVFSDVAFKYEETFTDEKRLSDVVYSDQSELRLDRKDVISGQLGWRKFPNMGLISNSHLVSISNIYLPQWSTPVNDGILLDPPPLLTGPPDEDQMSMEEDATEDDTPAIVPTMEMIKAQFLTSLDCECKLTLNDFTGDLAKVPHFNQLTAKSSLVTREQRMEELETCMAERTNRLGKQLDVNARTLEKFK